MAVRAEQLGRASTRAKVRRKGRLHRSDLTGYLMIAPMVILLAIFVLWPLVYAFYLSGYRINFYQGKQWVGLDFYRFVLEDPRFRASLEVGFLYVLYTVPTMLVVAFLLASLIKVSSRRVAAVLKTTVYVPAVLSSVIAAVVFVFIYQDEGFANWLGFGISTLILLAALLDIPESYYESAALDGAGWFRVTWHITIPLLRNVFLFLIVTSVVLTLQEFLLPLIMTGGGPVDSTNTPNLFIFNSFRDFTPYATSFALAASLLLFLVLGAVSLVIFKLISSVKAVDG